MAITRAKHTLIMIGSARTLGSGEAGEAASDLIRAAASANAIWSYTEQRTAEIAPQLKKCPPPKQLLVSKIVLPLHPPLTSAAH